MNCILCSADTDKKEKINSNQIKHLWQSTADISSLIKQDYYYMFECNSCGLLFFDTKLIGDSSFYDKINESAWYYDDLNKDEYTFASKFITKSDKILDIGCGFGKFTNFISNKENFTGLDISENARDYGTKNNIKIINELIQNHCIKNENNYDVITCFQILEHIDNPVDFIKKALITLKKDGLFIISVPNEESYLKYIPNNKFNLPPHHSIFWKQKQLIKIAEIFNLTILEVDIQEIAKVHKPEAKFAFFYKILCYLNNKKIQKIDYSPKYFKLYNIAFKLIRIIPSFITDLIFKLNTFRVSHTITIVYKKN